MSTRARKTTSKRKRSTGKKLTKRKLVKKLKNSTEAAMKAGLTPAQIVGIALGGTAAAGLGTTAAILAARDKEFYDDYVTSSMNEGYQPTPYQKFRGYPERYINQIRRGREEDLTKEGNQFLRSKTFSPAFQEMRGRMARQSLDFGRKKRRKRRKKRRKKVKKKRKFGGSHKTSCGHEFGKKAKKPSAALRRLCKKHKVRLTVKRGKKRVYKSEKVLKKQCKKAMKRKRKK